MHALRMTFGTMLTRTGVPMRTAQQLTLMGEVPPERGRVRLRSFPGFSLLRRA
jgi:hypothetical protein